MKLNDAWSFRLGDSEYLPVRLPHDWLISDTQNLYKSGVGWYRRTLDTRAFPADARVYLRFDGVYMDSTVFVNGEEAGQWKYGYTAFDCEISSLLRLSADNEIVLRVNYQAPSGRWYTGAGIYRDVELVVKEPVHFVPERIYVHSEPDENGGWVAEIEAELRSGSAGANLVLRHRLLELDGSRIDQAVALRGKITKTKTMLALPPSIEAWDIDRPRLYTLRSELLADGRVLDTVDTRIGFRRLEFTTDGGMLLNGRRVKLFGVCLHHDLGALGSAVHPDAIRRQLALFRAMGANAVRTAHNPPARVFMDIADEMGLLVMSEILDMWELPKNEFDYARFFDQWIDKDVASWIRRDRNHPSLIMWSVGNEIPDTHRFPERGREVLQRLLDLVRLHDPAGNAPATLCSNYMPWEGTQKSAEIVKLVGYNYGETLYKEHHAAHPAWTIYGSETCSTVQSRGVYHFPLASPVLADDDLQCSALGNSSTSWGARNVEACIRTDLDTEFSLGQFIWAGQDYLGEPTPYHSKNSYLGHVDTAGFPKDSYYVFQAAWTDHRRRPMVHLFPYWDFSPGQIIDVRVCSNAPSVELFLDDESLGRVFLEGDSSEAGRHLRPGGTSDSAPVRVPTRQLLTAPEARAAPHPTAPASTAPRVATLQTGKFPSAPAACGPWHTTRRAASLHGRRGEASATQKA